MPRSGLSASMRKESSFTIFNSPLSSISFPRPLSPRRQARSRQGVGVVSPTDGCRQPLRQTGVVSLSDRRVSSVSPTDGCRQSLRQTGVVSLSDRRLSSEAPTEPVVRTPTDGRRQSLRQTGVVSLSDRRVSSVSPTDGCRQSLRQTDAMRQYPIAPRRAACHRKVRQRVFVNDARRRAFLFDWPRGELKSSVMMPCRARRLFV